jgi:CHRD domain-containing protein
VPKSERPEVRRREGLCRCILSRSFDGEEIPKKACPFCGNRDIQEQFRQQRVSRPNGNRDENAINSDSRLTRESGGHIVLRNSSQDGKSQQIGAPLNIKSIGILALAVLFTAPAAFGATEVFSAKLLGDNEVPPNNTAGTATFHMEVDSNGAITFSITFSGLSTPLVVAHLHFAPTKVAGGVMIFLCGGGNQPACPAGTSGTITGTITAASVTGPAAQGINPADLTSALEAVRDGNAYSNMHTTKLPGGEIRGQVHRGDK